MTGQRSGEPVAWRARSSAPATLPTYISKVTRVLLCPASRDTSLTSSFQVLSAVVQNTCLRACRQRRQAACWSYLGGGVPRSPPHRRIGGVPVSYLARRRVMIMILCTTRGAVVDRKSTRLN